MTSLVRKLGFNTISLLALGFLLPLVLPYLVKRIIDDAILGGHLQLLWLYAGIGVVASVGAYAAQYFGKAAAAQSAEGFWQELRLDAFTQLRRLSGDFHASQPSGELVSRIFADTYHVKTFLGAIAPACVELLVAVVATAGILIVLAPKVFFLALVPLPLTAILIIAFRKRVQRLATRVREQEGALYALLVQGVVGISELQVLDSGTAYQRDLEVAGRRLCDSQVAFKRFRAMVMSTVSALAAIFLLGVLAVGGFYVAAGALSLGTLVAYYFYISRSLAPVRGAAAVVMGWHTANAAQLRLRQFLDHQHFLAEPAEPTPVPASWSTTVVQDVSFSYSSQDRATHVLRGINLSINKSTSIAILGASGAGKSTLAKLILRLFDPDQGEITYGGIPLPDFNSTEWRSHVGYVGQEAILFHGSIAHNILVGALGKVSDEELQRVVRIARVAEFAGDGTDTLDGEVGENGRRLSGGQKKRIALARALIRNPRILVIDQLAADLEADLCRAIFEDIRREYPDMAILHVGHRVPAGFEPDQVFWMERGRLRPHENVPEGEEGAKVRLVTSQE